jgi:spermidine/putrescine transport system permease protein
MSGSERLTSRHRALWVYFVLYSLLLYLPLVILAVFSFHKSATLALPWQGFSLRWYRQVAHSPELLHALRTSLVVAGLSAAIATVVGTAAGIAIGRFRFRGRSALAAIGLAPLAVPYLGLAVALLVTFVTLGIRPSISTVVIGHTVIAIPYVLLLVGTRVAGLAESLEEAAADLGAPWYRVLLRVYLPIAAPAIVVGFITAFQVSFDEFYLAFFLTGFNPTLPVYFFSSLRQGNLVPPALALTTAVTVVSVIVLLGTWAISSRYLRSDARPEVG